MHNPPVFLAKIIGVLKLLFHLNIQAQNTFLRVTKWCVYHADSPQMYCLLLSFCILYLLNNETHQSKISTIMSGEILIYQAQAGNIKIDVRLENETVWLTQQQMALLFAKAQSTINEHIQNIYQEGELEKEGTLLKFGNSEFQQKAPNYYSLDVIISVGYRVKSLQGT